MEDITTDTCARRPHLSFRAERRVSGLACNSVYGKKQKPRRCWEGDKFLDPRCSSRVPPEQRERQRCRPSALRKHSPGFTGPSRPWSLPKAGDFRTRNYKGSSAARSWVEVGTEGPARGPTPRRTLRHSASGSGSTQRIGRKGLHLLRPFPQM